MATRHIAIWSALDPLISPAGWRRGSARRRRPHSSKEDPRDRIPHVRKSLQTPEMVPFTTFAKPPCPLRHRPVLDTLAKVCAAYEFDASATQLVIKMARTATQKRLRGQQDITSKGIQSTATSDSSPPDLDVAGLSLNDLVSAMIERNEQIKDPIMGKYLNALVTKLPQAVTDAVEGEKRGRSLVISGIPESAAELPPSIKQKEVESNKWTSGQARSACVDLACPMYLCAEV
ncbi:hypothetical protein OSTOST_03139 [Ostertagia ostertagi]